MHTNYYLLKHLAHVLDEDLRNSVIVTCYSQDKDELVIGIDRQQSDFFIHASLKSPLCMLRFPEELKRARKNSVELFEPILGLSILGVNIYAYERCLYIQLEQEYSLIFKLFSQGANVLLARANQVVDIFKKRNRTDLDIDPSTLAKPGPQGLPHFQEVSGDLRAYIPTLGPQLRQHLYQQGYQEQSISTKWNMLNSLLDNLSVPDFYVGWLKDKPAITTFAIENLEYEGTDVIKALNQFYRLYITDHALTREKQAQISRLRQNIKKGQRYLKKTQSRLDELKAGVSNQTMADLLMAYMHQVPPGAKMVELPHFETGAPVSIKLKADLTPQKNAAYYYRKEKNQKQELEVLQKSIERKVQELDQWQSQLKFIDACQDLKVLRQFIKERSPNLQKTSSESLFKTYQHQGFTILVGRNARNNDLLTQKHAHKDDLWLHAKDVRGSHVVVKHQAGQKFPAPVIQRAAELAAFYSKRKHDSLCPVTFTPKKYVRKPKGLAPGQVVVDREEVILVEPKA